MKPKSLQALEHDVALPLKVSGDDRFSDGLEALRLGVDAVLLSPAAVVRADELKVLSAATIRFGLKDVGDNFTRMTGTKLVITFGSAGGVKTKLEKGEPVDVVILPKPDIAARMREVIDAAVAEHSLPKTHM